MTLEFPDEVTTTVLREPDGPTIYAAMAVRIVPNEDMGTAGFHSPDTLYVVFESAHPVADYDPFRLSRRLSGRSDWVIDQLEKLKEELPPVPMADGADEWFICRSCGREKQGRDEWGADGLGMKCPRCGSTSVEHSFDAEEPARGEADE